MAKRKRRKKDPTDVLISSAPKKKAPKRTAPDATTTHKARAAWFNAREAWPMREAPVELLTQAKAAADANIEILSVNATWTEAGPKNIGGRMTSMVVHPQDAERIWVGAAGGGIWSSQDGGRTWTPLWHSEPTLNVGALCIDPANPDVLYCGTGEANLSADSHPGVGVYRSLDGGTTWHLLASAQTQDVPRRIGRIAVDPFDSNHILLGGVGHRSQDSRGLFVTTDGGLSWARVSAMIPSPYQCHEVVFHPQTQGTIYITIDAVGFDNGIWRTTDSGQTWTHLTSGLPSSPGVARTSLAIATSKPSVIYAQTAAHNGSVRGVFRTANGGNTWTDISGNHFRLERQMTYNNAISVDPDNADVVLCGGVDLHRTKNGGQTWKKITDWSTQRGNSNYAHADQHALCHPASESGLVYAMNDGGMDVSLDGGTNWENRSDGLATNMFYDVAVAESNADVYGGGMQDNGTWLTLDGQPGSFIETTGGDGGFCAIDPSDELHLFTSSQFMRVNRFRRTDGWAQNIGPNETGDRPWMAFIAIDPDRPKRVFVASQRIWRSTNDGNTWQDLTGSLDGSFVTCIEVSRADTDTVYVGTENGGIFKSDDGGGSWSGNIASSVLPFRTITRLRTPADNADVVYATLANFGNRHLFRSTNGGETWQDVDNGLLPDAPHHGIAIPSDDAETIYVAGDAGVFVSQDAAATWRNLTSNLPTVMVIDLILQETTNALFAATYGRSIWRLDLSSLP